MDEMRELYQKAFHTVEAPAALREKVLQMEHNMEPKTGRYVRRLSGVMAAAVVTIALLGCAAVAVVYGDNIQGWFGHYWEAVTGRPMSDNQTAVIEHLSQEISLSQTVGDVTVTVDSATVGDDAFFLLLRVEGKKLSSRYSYGFDKVDLTVSPDPLEETGGLGSFGFQHHGIDGDGAALLMIDHSYASKDGFEADNSPLEVTLKLEDFVRNAHTDREKLLEEGIWEFSFTLDRGQAYRVLELPDSEVLAIDLDQKEERPVLLTHIEITNMGMRFRYNYEGGTVNVSSHTYAVLENGLKVHSGGGNGTVMEDGETLNCSIQWSVPVDLDEVEAIRIGSTEIPVP